MIRSISAGVQARAGTVSPHQPIGGGGAPGIGVDPGAQASSVRGGAITRARDNPFAVERLHRLGFRSPATGAPADLEAVLERLAALGHRAAVVGPEGSGKTTLLEALAPRLAERGYDVLPLRYDPAGDGVAAPGSLSPRSYLLVDGADHLPRRDWRRLRGASLLAGGLLVTSHRPGLLPTLVSCRTTPALLEALEADLLRGAPRRALPPAADLHARHRGNLRRALLELYDLYAGR